MAETVLAHKHLDFEIEIDQMIKNLHPNLDGYLLEYKFYERGCTRTFIYDHAQLSPHRCGQSLGIRRPMM